MNRVQFSIEQFALSNNIKLNKNQVSFITNKLFGLTTFVYLPENEMSDALRVYEQYSQYIHEKSGEDLNG